ncbi:helix-turn-helix domain-containing protein [Paraburkholderia sp. J8-2]|uniref:helix-turn-helix domain-containing protein n=1 Tax=Paraburkholderia sp. J8-2 TaxID=2805440 RepID=UPI0039EE7FF7
MPFASGAQRPPFARHDRTHFPLCVALDQNGRRRKDTAQFLGISRKVLWEKIRNRQIFYERPETRESE